jgi:hypothetical protein
VYVAIGRGSILTYHNCPRWPLSVRSHGQLSGIQWVQKISVNPFAHISRSEMHRKKDADSFFVISLGNGKLAFRSQTR